MECDRGYLIGSCSQQFILHLFVGFQYADEGFDGRVERLNVVGHGDETEHDKWTTDVFNGFRDRIRNEYSNAWNAQGRNTVMASADLSLEICLPK